MATKKAPVNMVIIVGTRPEAIKMAPVYLAMKRDSRLKVTMAVTAQHRHMLDQVLGVFGVVPDIDLDIMQPNQNLSEVSARVIVGIHESLSRIKPDAAIVHGDTATCLFSAVAAFYLQIPVGHVEAGLRTYNFKAPWPEEMNRRLVDPICRWCWAPTKSAADNLRSEHIPEGNIFVTGNTVVDALHLARDIVRRRKPNIEMLQDKILENKRLILVTGHRRESFGKPFEELCYSLKQLAQKHKDVVLVYSVHLNPNVQRPVRKILGNQENIYLIPPLEYLQFVYLMDRSYFIITDSGGIQEEAPSLHKPVLVTRAVTERPEAVQAGYSILVGTCRERILAEASRLLCQPKVYEKMSMSTNPYGDGRASQRILDSLILTLRSK